jgi:hypothetical protein
MRKGRQAGKLAMMLLVAALAAPAARAVDGYVGVGVGHSTRDDHNFVAGELLWPIDSPLRLNLNVEYFRASGVRHFTTSLDVVYFGSLRPIDPRLAGWIGVGFGVLTRDPVGPGQSTTRDGQFDVIVGVGFEGPVMPFAQLKLAAGKPTYMLGLRFAF